MTETNIENYVKPGMFINIQNTQQNVYYITRSVRSSNLTAFSLNRNKMVTLHKGAVIESFKKGVIKTYDKVKLRARVFGENYTYDIKRLTEDLETMEFQELKSGEAFYHPNYEASFIKINDNQALNLTEGSKYNKVCIFGDSHGIIPLENISLELIPSEND